MNITSTETPLKQLADHFHHEFQHIRPAVIILIRTMLISQAEVCWWRKDVSLI